MIGQLGMAAGKALVGGAVGMGLNRLNQKSQVRQQEKLNKQQIKGAKEMSDYEKGNQLDIWNKTNYGAQVKHMKEAGLNPALMYGMGGQGGATTGGGSGAMPTGGMAESGSQQTQSMMDMAMMAAQTKVLESQARKNEVEATKIEGVDTKNVETQTTDLLQGIENKKVQNELMKLEKEWQTLENSLKESTIDTNIEKLIYETGLAKEALQQAQNETYISTETRNEKIRQINNRGVQIILENAAIKQGIQLDQARIKEIANNINVRLEELVISREGQQTSRENMESLTEAMLWGAGINALGNVAGDVINLVKPKMKGQTTETKEWTTPMSEGETYRHRKTTVKPNK